MFLDHFGLIEQPFGVTPDPRFLHLGHGHREALASLIYGTENNRGFLALVGPPGIGKTSLLFQYLEKIRNTARTAFLFQSASNGKDLMRYLLYDLGKDPAGMDIPRMHQALNDLLAGEMRAGRGMVLVIDEAQNLSRGVLEFVRLLSNFETPWMKLLQIVIAGQPQLAERLARPPLIQLRQRISCFIHLQPFEPDETSAYISHRLWAAGYDGPGLFTGDARLAVAGFSGGIPRNINNLCFHSMSIACAAGKKQVDAAMVEEAAVDSAACSRFEDFPAALPAFDRAGTSSVSLRPIPSLPAKGVVAAVTAGSKNRSMRLQTIATVCAVLFVVIVSGSRWKAAVPTTPLDVTPSVEASVLPASEPPWARAPETMSSHSPEVVAVVAEEGTTLRHLSLLYLDSSDPLTLAQIAAFNRISDPRHIKVGQTIRIPLSLRGAIGPPEDAGTQTAGAPDWEGKP